jgi:hypothetical protein
VACGALATIDIPLDVTPFEHRILPQVSFVGTHGEQMRYLIASPAQGSEWRWLSWSDAERPSLCLWRVSDVSPGWSSLAFEFLEPVWIQAASMSPIGQKIGIVMTSQTQTVVGVWEVDSDLRLRQVNRVCEDIGDFLAACWLRQFKFGKELSNSFFVIGSLAILEISPRSAYLWPQSPTVAFEDLGNTRFYINRDLDWIS